MDRRVPHIAGGSAQDAPIGVPFGRATGALSVAQYVLLTAPVAVDQYARLRSGRRPGSAWDGSSRVRAQ